MISQASAIRRGPVRPTTSERFRPSTYSMTRKCRPSATAGVGGPNDVRMVQFADGIHLALEAGHALRVLRQARERGP